MNFFSVLLIQTVFIHHLYGRLLMPLLLNELPDNNRENCGHNNQSNCLIEATFSTLMSNESIDVLVNCSTVDEFNKFLNVDKIIWSGCYAGRNLKYLGLQKISSRNQIKFLKIEKFSTNAIEGGTFDGFSRLEVLSIESNFIQNLSSTCFRGLKNLLLLQMIENSLKWIDSSVFGVLTKLNVLQITEPALFMANNQFFDNQIVDSAVMEINNIKMDLFEHLFNHVRNLSISLRFSISLRIDHSKYRDDSNEISNCEQTKFNGYEKSWIVENLKLDNLKCGFMMENVESIKSLILKRVIQSSFYNNEFRLKNLKNLQAISLNENELYELSISMFDGYFGALEIIDLSFNRLTEIDMSIFNRFPKLKAINLSNNLIKILENFETLNFLHVQMIVDNNTFHCEWLERMATNEKFKNFIYIRSFKLLNVNGLECSLHLQRNSTVEAEAEALFLDPYVNNTNNTATTMASFVDALQWKLNELHDENFIVKPKIFAFIVCGVFLLGIAITFITIYTYNRRQLLKHQPFYHMLRASIIRPISDARETFARDFKGIILRNLPPTNYEHPISDSSNHTEATEVEGFNIYEEIPQ